MGSRRKTLLAQSGRTGIQHQFRDWEAWEQIADDMERTHEANLEQVLLASLPFAEHLKSASVPAALISETCPDTIYRYANPAYGALAVEGSLAHGGRFNMGGAQMSPHFPNLKPRACLYAASTRDCADAEAARPLGVLKMYEIRPKSPLKLWNLSKVIDVIDYPNLLDEIKRSNGEALWGLQKVPTISQIVAEFLRDIGGDGLVFESTKRSPALNVVSFVRDKAHAATLFDEKPL